MVGGQRRCISVVNQLVEELQLGDTHFETAHGLDAPGDHSTAYELAVVSRESIHGEPDGYRLYSPKRLAWNGPTQNNRNGLLWAKTMNDHGLKPGDSSRPGLNLIAAAVVGLPRLLACRTRGSGPNVRGSAAHKLSN
ncbi:hypothetical protein [Klebsiella pneumoniae]|uniref:hypothetical protein n=1 Tax=Klebsiella pneumoniae TaxID=573 RepID=UPI0035B2D0F8